MLAALRLVPLALAGAALLVPLLTVVYTYLVDVYEHQPYLAVAFTAVWGAIVGVVVGYLAGGVAASGAGLLDGTSDAHVVTAGVLLPLLGFAATLAGPLVLLPYRRYNDVLDGATFGAVTAASVAGAQVLVYGAHMFDRGVRPGGDAGAWVVRVLAIAVAQPVLSMSAAGFAAAALWLRYRAPVEHRRALGVVGSPLAAIPLAAALIVAGTLLEPLLPGGSWLVCLGAMAAVGLTLLRRAIHVGLRQEAEEAKPGGAVTCANCGAVTPRRAFCSTCGIAIRALPKARDPADQGAFHGRISRMTAGVAFALALLGCTGAAAGIAALNEAPAPRPPCVASRPCGRPPIAKPLTGPVVWRSSELGFAAEYDAGDWRLSEGRPDRLTLTSTIGEATLTLRGARRPPGELLQDQLSALSSTFLGLAPDRTPENELLGMNVGLRPGPGGAYVGSRRGPQGLAAQDSIAVMAAGDGRTSVVAAVITPASFPQERARVFGIADRVIKSVAWASDLRDTGAAALFNGTLR